MQHGEKEGEDRKKGAMKIAGEKGGRRRGNA